MNLSRVKFSDQYNTCRRWKEEGFHQSSSLAAKAAKMITAWLPPSPFLVCWTACRILGAKRRGRCDSEPGTLVFVCVRCWSRSDAAGMRSVVALQGSSFIVSPAEGVEQSLVT